jgi:ketosteroid isomerase-like protein
MQYQSELDRDGLVNLAIKQYFANVDAKDIDKAVDCFHDNAMFTVQTAFTTHAGKAEIRRMLEDFTSSYEKIVHRDFEVTVDSKNGRVAASFIAEMTDAEGNITLLQNTNFWRIRGTKFQEVYVYMSGENPLT